MSDQNHRLPLCSGIESLPNELYGKVCEQLETKDIAKLRLVSKHSSEVATPYFLSCVHLIFTTESFKTLYNISQHPVIRQHVTSILYEADTLEEQDRAEWEEWVYDADYLNRILPELVIRDGVEVSKESKHASYTKEQLDRAWDQYQVELKDQKDLRRRGCGTEMLRASIACLPKLKTFRMTLTEGLYNRSHYLIQALGAGLPDASGKHLDLYASGVPQLQAVLLSMHNARIKLETFACGEVSWEFFQCSAKDWTAFAATLSQVRNFKLRLSTGKYIDETGADFRTRWNLMNCADLLSQAYDHLTKLEISLDPSEGPNFGLRLIDLVADHVWLRLSKVVLSGIETTEDELVEFLEKHRATLRKIRLGNICLTTGEWPHALPRMRSSIQLDYCLLEEFLSSKVPKRNFYLGKIPWKNEENTVKVDRCKNGKIDAINDWFLKGGKCPLTDEWSQ